MIDVQTIKANNPLEAIVQRFTGQEPVRHKIKAPWRDERTPSVHIYADGKFKDFGGDGWHGDVIDFVGYYLFGSSYNAETHFTEVIDRLGALDIQPLPRPTVERSRPAPPPMRVDLAQIERWHINMAPERREWWYGRGLIDETINRYLLGWDGKRYTIPCLYRGIPFAVKRRQSEIDDGIEFKYISTTGSRAGIFNADILWNTDRVVICEGEIDAMLLNQYGYPAVSSTAGANTWKPHWAHLFSQVRNVWILYDNDQAGTEGAVKVHQTLRRAQIRRLPDGIKDIGELLESNYLPCKWLDEVLR